MIYYYNVVKTNLIIIVDRLDVYVFISIVSSVFASVFIIVQCSAATSGWYWRALRGISKITIIISYKYLD